MHLELSQQDLKTLSKEIQEILKDHSWYQNHGIEWAKSLLRCGLFISGWAIFALGHWFFQIIGLVTMSYAFVSIAISGIHQASHKSLAKSSHWNRFAAFLYTDFWASKSHLWWKWRHIDTHHPHTNVIGKEPQPFYFPWMASWLYFFVTPYLVVPWFISSSIHFLRNQPKELLLYLVFASLGVIAQSSLFWVLGYSWGTSFFLMLLMRSLFAPVFLHIAVFNHIGLPSYDQDNRPLWLELQSKTTRNLKPHWFLKGLGGNAFLDGHLEHHLFPHLSNHSLSKIRNKVVEFLKNNGYEYREESYWYCLSQCLKHYDKLFHQLQHPLW